MEFDRPFLKLPILFDANALEQEVRALPASSWVPHPTGFVGNDAVRLVTVGGRPTDVFEGPMQPAADLARLPYVQQVMDELGGVWSRSRLMGLGSGAEVPEHIDAHYHWRTHLRIHVPIITNPLVRFTCADETIHMAPGECWLFDSFRWHRVENKWSDHRVHLVLDTVMTPSLRALIDAAINGLPGRFIAPDPSRVPHLRFERVNVPMVMSPWEIRCHLDFILDNAVDNPNLQAVRDLLDRFADAWAATWAEYEADPAGLSAYRQLLIHALTAMNAIAGEMKLRNSLTIKSVFESLIAGPALSPTLANATPIPTAGQRRAS